MNDIFVKSGFDNLFALEDLTKEVMNNMNVAIGHQGRFLCLAKQIVSLLLIK
jgi:hypothetical protein